MTSEYSLVHVSGISISELTFVVCFMFYRVVCFRKKYRPFQLWLGLKRLGRKGGSSRRGWGNTVSEVSVTRGINSKGRCTSTSKRFCLKSKILLEGKWRTTALCEKGSGGAPMACPSPEHSCTTLWIN